MILKLNNEQTSIKAVALMIIIAYIFSVGIRFIWVNEFTPLPQFHWNNELMINTNDGYLFAEGARDILAGTSQQYDLSGIHTSVAQLTAFLAKILPISFETLILYMPSFLGSLIVIPLVLIGRALNQTTIGFIAALLASIAHSYYNRTMSGYYDSDMLNIVFPVIIVYSLILAITHHRNRYLLPIALFVALYQWWYEQAYALDSALLFMIVGYTLLFDRRNLYLYKISLFVLIGILSIPLISKIGLALIIFSLFHWKKEFSPKIFWLIFGIIGGIYFFTGGFDPIWLRLKIYLFTQEGENTVATTLHFYNVMSTVREAGNIPFQVFAERISGHTITFLLACVGYLMAIIAYRPLLVTLPLVGLGFIAMFAGLRFTIYAVPAMAIGFAYLIVFLTHYIEKVWLRYLSLIVFTGAALYPNYLHVKEYMTPTVMTAQEVKALDQLKTISQREDYVITWWDYGYPIRYYADVKTWIDGGKHTGDVNYPASYVLTAQDPLAAANMMRLFTEYTEKGFSDTNKTQNDFEYMLKQERFSDPDEFLIALSLKDYKLPAKTRDVFLYLPFRMLDIFPTVTMFSNLDLKNPNNQPDEHFFYMTSSVQETDQTLELGNNIQVIKSKNTLKIGNQETAVKSFYKVGYTNEGKLQIDQQQFASDGLNLIFLASYGKFLVVDDFYLNSTYLQMFIFENYDKNLFEPVMLDPMTKIYKLKV